MAKFRSEYVISHIILKCLIILSIVCFRGPCLWKTIGKHFPPCRSSRVGHCFPPTSALEGSLAVGPRAWVLVSPPPRRPRGFLGLGSSRLGRGFPRSGALDRLALVPRVGPVFPPPTTAPSGIPWPWLAWVLASCPPWRPRRFLWHWLLVCWSSSLPAGTLEGSLALVPPVLVLVSRPLAPSRVPWPLVLGFARVSVLVPVIWF